MLKKFTVKQRRITALVLASAMVVTALAVGLSGTLAAKNPMIGDFTQQPNTYRDVEVGKTVTTNVIGAAYANSANTAIATTPSGKILGQPVQITGVSAGIAVISVGSTAGLVAGVSYQVWDNNNIVKYSIPNNGELFFSKANASQTKPSPASVETGVNTSAANAAAFGRIEWESLQPEIAEVAADGTITAYAKGAAIILGRFTDKWGVKQTMNILVGVETSLGDEDVADLLRALEKAKEIQDDYQENPNKWDDGGMDELDRAVTAGEEALNDPAGDKQKAADDIWDAILELQRKQRRNKLEDAIAWGEGVLDDAEQGKAKYDEALLKDLEDAIDEGKAILDDPDATDDQCNEAADKILDAIKKVLEGGMGPDIIVGDDGRLYRRVGRPPNVYEVLDEDGMSTYPPEYVYNPGDKPGNANDRKVYGPRRGIYYVEDPEGSNIYKPIDEDGNISDDGAIWGGDDFNFDTNDDKPAVKNEQNGKWYADLGQNVYAEIDSNPSSANYGKIIGSLFGAGEDLEPASQGLEDGDYDLVPIYQERDDEFGLPYWDGKYYAGPFNSAALGTYWIGDRNMNDGGDGMLNTSGNGAGGHGPIAESDQVWYMDANGNMVKDRVNYNVTSVTVEPATIELHQSQGYQFIATANPTATTPQKFNWEVIGANSPNTIITNSGILVISRNETATTLTVRATSTVAANRSGTATVTVKPDLPPVMTEANVDRIATGRTSYLVKDNGSIWSAGRNLYGQLGVGDTTDRRAFTPLDPTSVMGLTFNALSVYGYNSTAHVLALTKEKVEGEGGVLYTWGYNNYGQLGNGNTTKQTRPVMTTLRDTVKFKAVSAGMYFSAAIDMEGRLWTWGYNSDGQLGTGNTTRVGTPQLMPTTLRFRAVACGERSMYGITTDGKLYAWGSNSSGRLGDGTTTSRRTPGQVIVGGNPNTPIKAVACRSHGHALILTELGDLYACGPNAYGQLGTGNTTNTSKTPPVKVSASVKFDTIATGHYFSMALTADGNLYAWGQNTYGQLGNGNTTRQTSPVWVNYGAMKYRAMAGGEYTSMAITDEGRLYFWGYNNYGQYGNGTTIRQRFPTYVPLA